jgi:hypothetical protein
MSTTPRQRAILALFASLLLFGCTDRDLLTLPAAPETPPTGTIIAAIECRVTVADRSMGCTQLELPPETPGVNATVILGGQNTYVRVATVSASYDGGAQVFSADMTVQNLVAHLMGTPDGNTVSGVSVFFHTPPAVTGGSGSIAVANADGQGTFTGANQDYFLYNQILSPYEISQEKTWLFNVDNTVTTFSFVLYVSAQLDDEASPRLDAVWQGDVSTDWEVTGNWSNGAVPDSTSVVAVPNQSLMVGPNMPTLTAAARVLHLRVGLASTLGLANQSFQVDGNLDAEGTISGGSTTMSGAGALLKGNVDALVVTGSTFLQGTAKATGAVSITGSLTNSGNVLTIAVP